MTFLLKLTAINVILFITALLFTCFFEQDKELSDKVITFYASWTVGTALNLVISAILILLFI